MTLTTNELVNLAMESMVDVISNVNLDLSYGHLLNFSPPNYFAQNNTGKIMLETFKPFKLPLFMAIHLQKRLMVKIEIPNEYKMLDKFIEREEQNETFSELPKYFFEIAHILKISDCRMDKLKQLRAQKIWKGFQSLEDATLFINNFTRWEFNQLKHFITNVYKQSAAITKLNIEE